MSLTLDQLIEAGHATGWHYYQATLWLGYKGRGNGTIRRTLQAHGTSWGELALSLGEVNAEQRRRVRQRKLTILPAELAKIAAKHDWNQERIAEAADCCTAVIHHRVKAWGFPSWQHFCAHYGGRTKAILSEDVIIQAGIDHGWSIRAVHQALGFSGGGAITRWIQGHTDYPGWTAFRDAHKDVTVPAPVIDQLVLPLPTQEPLVRIAQAKGWHPDLVAWELGLEDRKALNDYLKGKGYHNWKKFMEAFHG